MNKNAYLSELRARLVSIPLDEREAAVKFYEEFFEDAGEENEQAVIADLGSPSELAKSIISDQSAYSRNEDYLTYKQSEAAESIILDDKKQEAPAQDSDTAQTGTADTQPAAASESSSRNTVLIILLTIFLGIPVCSVAISLLTSLFAILLSWGVVCAVLIIVGIMIAAGGITSLITSPAEGIALVGAGLLLSGVGLLLLIPFILCVWRFLPYLFVQTGRFFKYLGKKLSGV